MDCPLEGCPARTVNIRRHLTQIHDDQLPVWRINQLPVWRINQFIGIVGRKSKAAVAIVENEAGETLSRNVNCPLCNGAYSRVDRHLKAIHKLTGAELKAQVEHARRAPASPNKSVHYEASLLEI